MREGAKAQVKVKDLKIMALKITEEISFACSLLSVSLFIALYSSDQSYILKL